jgi:hypothetical protein
VSRLERDRCDARLGGYAGWLASSSDRATAVLQVLAVGVLVNCLARVPLTVLQAKGRPDLPAKYHLAELPSDPTGDGSRAAPG